ncbi:hypothetical protein ACTFIT_000204 [Dictyostelium discoideum]
MDLYIFNTNFFLGETGIHIGHSSLSEEELCFSYLFRSTSKSYVGDSVLDFFVSDFLYTAFPDHRSLLVRISNLSSISRKLNLPPTLSKGIHDTLPLIKLDLRTDNPILGFLCLAHWSINLRSEAKDDF